MDLAPRPPPGSCQIGDKSFTNTSSDVKAWSSTAEASSVILLDEAVERCNRAGRAYGIRIDPWRRRSVALGLIADIEEAIAPLGLPVELRAFWARWNPAALAPPVFDGFIPLDQMVERREIDCPPCPSILLPIADWAYARIWIELSSDEHPGGRIFHSYHDESELTLWAFGISGLLDLIAESLEQDAIDDRAGTIHVGQFERIIRTSLDDSLPAGSPRRFEGVDRSLFPPHWQRSEGLADDHFVLRGATHTVDRFLDEREADTHVIATLVGSYQTSVGGGPLQGCVGTFEDFTGSLQVFVPQLTAVAGAIGHDGAVEIDVMSVEPNGAGLNSLTARSELQRAAEIGRLDCGKDMLERLFEQMRYLDTSIVVTGMRPIR